MEKKTEIVVVNEDKDSNFRDTVENSNEISLIDLIQILLKFKYIIIICTIFSILAGLFYALTQKESFSTKTIFITKTKRNNNTALGQIAMLSGINLGSSGNIDPSDYLDKVIDDKEFLATLFERKWLFYKDSQQLDQIFEIEPDTTIPDWEYSYFISKIESIRKNKVLSINKDASTGILVLTTKAPSPKLSYDLNLYTLDYLRYYIRNSIKTQAKEKRTFIEERIKESKEELSKNENELARFKERNLMSTSPQVALEETRLLRKMTISQEVYIQFQKQYELAKIEELDDQTLIQIVKNPEIPIKRSWPKNKMILAIASLSGIFIGVFITFLYHVTTLICAEIRKRKLVKILII